MPSLTPLQPEALPSTSCPLEAQVAAVDLPLSEAYNLLAALMQVIGMVLLCVAIYMRNWVWLEPDEAVFLGPRPLVSYTFGIPYQLNTSRNDSENLYFFQKDRSTLRLIMITLCSLNLCFGITAFLLDYLEIQVLEKHRVMLVSSFHLFSGISTLALVAICIWCLEKVSQWFLEPEWKKYAMLVRYGESFYIGLLTFTCAILAVTFTLCAIRLSAKQKPPSKAPDAKQ